MRRQYLTVLIGTIALLLATIGLVYNGELGSAVVFSFLLVPPLLYLLTARSASNIE